MSRDGDAAREAMGVDGAARPAVRVDGTVREALPNAVFRIELDSGHDVLAHPSRELRLHCGRILPGRRVTLEVSTYDRGRGRILKIW